MKKIFGFLVLSLTLLFLTTSCEKGSDSLLEVTPETVNAELSSSKDSIVTEYPSTIDDYVAANHPGASISEVALEDDGTYEVTLDNDEELYFDADGNFIEEMDDDEEEDEMEDEDEEYDDEEDESDEDEYVTDYPSSIDDYVATNHPNATIVEVELEDDGTYEVELDDDTEIIFDADGNFVEYDD